MLCKLFDKEEITVFNKSAQTGYIYASPITANHCALYRKKP